MTPEQHARMREIFEVAVHLPPERYAAYLEEACGGDVDLLERVRTLLAADHETGEAIFKQLSDLHGQRPLDPKVPEKQGVLSPGTRLGPYEILSLIGEGGAGKVYRARDTRLGRQVAIKTVHERLSGRFEREARVIAALRHPNICRLYDIGPDYLVMELLEGDTLKNRMKGAALSLDAALDFCIQLTEALEAAHAQKIIHRDIKPANIFVSTRGQAILLDFGLAKSRADLSPDLEGTQAVNESLTLQGLVMGTPSYMSPEQALGEEVDSRSDLFSLGAVLYEMATGVQCFTAETMAGILRKVMQMPPTPPSQLNHALPIGLDRIVRKALEKDRESRYQHAADILSDLRELRSARGPAIAGNSCQRGWMLTATSAVARVFAQAQEMYRNRWWEVSHRAFILRFVGLALIALASRQLFETTTIGQDFRQFESTVLQAMLGISHNPDYLPIIINISPTRKADAPTDRPLLDGLIKKLDSMQVRAIGIDVDFSPLDDGQPVTPVDWNYFHEWTELAKDSGLELRLGVYRRATDIPAHWLGLQEFVHLAAGIATPSDDQEYNFYSVNTPRSEDQRASQLPPMSVALFTASGGKLPSSRVVHRDNDVGLLRTSRYRIDYSDSMLRLLSAQTIDYARPEDLDIAEAARKITFRGKVVLIGDSTMPDDQFCRPFSTSPTSGLIAHAASLVTLRQGGLQDIEGGTASALDMAIIALDTFLLWIFHRWRKVPLPGLPKARAAASARGGSVGAAGNVETVTMVQQPAASLDDAKRLDVTQMSYCGLVALLTATIGLVVVRMNSVVWPDFLWVSTALLIHSFVSDSFFPYWGGLTSEIRRTCRQIFPSSKGGSHAR